MRRQSAVIAALVLTAGALTGCASEDADSDTPADPAGIQEEAFDDPTDIAVDGQPPECVAVSVGWYPGVDIASLDNSPSDWPAPPEGSTLCSTSSGGSIETASYASALGIDEILAYFKDELPSSYSAEVTSGEDNGTGYESLDGNGPGVAFQVRENDGVFTLAFANEADQ